MTDIQRARDILTKWRSDAQDGPWRFADEGKMTWTVRTDQPQADIYGDPYDDNVGELDGFHEARLIVGTAGNPALWEAIDGMLRDVQANALYPSHHAERIAAAINAAEERMSV